MFGYKLFYDGGYLTEHHGFETYEEAKEEAREEMKSRIDDWESEDAWNEYDSIDLFEAKIIGLQVDTVHF